MCFFLLLGAQFQIFQIFKKTGCGITLYLCQFERQKNIMQFFESKNPSNLRFYSNLLPQTVLPMGTKCSNARDYRGNSNANHHSFPTNLMEDWKLNSFFTKSKGNVAMSYFVGFQSFLFHPGLLQWRTHRFHIMKLVKSLLLRRSQTLAGSQLLLDC